MTKEIKKSLAAFESAREQAVNSILESEISKVEKLRLIQDNNIWPAAPYKEDVFHIAKEEYKKILGKQDWYCMDCALFEAESRGKLINFADYLENFAWDNASLKEEWDLLTIRGGGPPFKATLVQIIDWVFDYAVEKKIVGYHFDW